MITQLAATPYLLVDACMTSMIQKLISKQTLAEQHAVCLDMLATLPAALTCLQSCSVLTMGGLVRLCGTPKGVHNQVSILL